MDKNGKCLKTLQGHQSFVKCLIETKDEKIVIGYYDGTIEIWNKDGICLETFIGHSNSVQYLIETKDGKVVSGSWDNTIKIWEINPNE